MLEIIVSSIAVIALIIGSITDIKTREVPDWLNFSLIPLALGIRLIASLASNDYSFIISGLIGFVSFFLLALFMFYTGQWGGGDSKMLMGIGALVGLEFNLNTTLISFLVNVVIVGSLYGLFWSMILVFQNRNKFFKEFKKMINSIKLLQRIILTIFLILIAGSLLIDSIVLKMLVISFLVVLYFSFYLILFVKIVEKSCMLKYVNPTEVTEGDWIVKDIYIGKEFISGPKDLGIEKKQLNKLIAYYKKGKIKKVLIKIGIPFVPSFLIAYIMTLMLGNLLLYLII